MDIIKDELILACNKNDIDKINKIVDNIILDAQNYTYDNILNIIHVFLYFRREDFLIFIKKIINVIGVIKNIDKKELNYCCIKVAHYGFLNMVKLLIEDAGCDLNYYDDYFHCGLDYGSSPFSEAAREGHIDIVKYLLSLHKNNNKYPKVDSRHIEEAILALIHNYHRGDFEENIQNKKLTFLFLLKINKDLKIPFLDDIVQSEHFGKIRPEFTNKIKNDHIDFFVCNVINCGGIHINKKYDSALLYKPRIVL